MNSAPLRSPRQSGLDLLLVDPLGERHIQEGEFPLTLGGEGARIAVPGLPRDAIAGQIEREEGGLLVAPPPLPEEGGEGDIEGPRTEAPAIRLNGRIVRDPQRLQDGDVLSLGEARIQVENTPRGTTLRVLHLAGNATAAPLTEEDAGEIAEDEAATQTIARARFTRSAGTVVKARRPVRARSLIFAGVVAVVAIAWFLGTAVSVQVKTDPANAEVDFADAWPEISVGEQHMVLPGSYTLVASSDGFKTARQPVRVGNGADPRVQVKLVRLPGKVKFDTLGIPAKAFVDGTPLGDLPGEHQVPAGVHDLVVRAPRYQELKGRIDIDGGGLAQQIKVTLVPNFAPVTIESTPAGARITVDGKDIGATPHTVDLDAGSYTLTLAAQGFKNWETAVQVEAGKPQKIGPVQLGLPDGRLTVRSSPAQADVAIAGRYRGRTPLELDLAPGMEHDIVIQRAGYEPSPRRVRIKAAERLALQVTLKPIFGDVTVRGTPTDAVLYVAGEARGPANQTLKLPAAETPIEIRREGLETFATTVTPQPGLPRVVEYALLSAEQKRAGRMPAVVKLKTGGEIRLMPTGRFQMGSPRREPGRRANESQRAVTLQRPFYLGTYEVTNAEYRQFRKDHLSGVFGERSLDLDKQPVSSINWHEAAEFCNWLSEQHGLPPAYVQSGDALVAANPMTTGFRMPTEAEWEWAARYEGGSAARRYPWGAALPVAPKSGNYADSSAATLIGASLEGYSDSFVVTSPVGSFAPNALGLYDMGGNVSEWTHDFYTSYVDLSKQADTDPMGPESGRLHVVRGSHWRTAGIAELRLAYRDGGEGRSQNVGLRVARYGE